MSITLIDNQAVRFRLLTEIEADTCDCGVKPYCQKVNKFDVSKFQIISSSVLTNGSFADGLNGWAIEITISLSIAYLNESSAGACDGEMTITASGGTAPYEYSIDGITFQGTTLFENLCEDCYNVVVRDADDNYGTATICIETNVDCGAYAGSETNDFLAFNTNQLLNCETNDFI